MFLKNSVLLLTNILKIKKKEKFPSDTIWKFLLHYPMLTKKDPTEVQEIWYSDLLKKDKMLKETKNNLKFSLEDYHFQLMNNRSMISLNREELYF